LDVRNWGTTARLGVSGDACQSEQQCVERISRTAPQFLKNHRFSLAGNKVEPVGFEAPLGFFRFKAAGARPKPLAAIFRR
jgi:hypothetical protein